MEWLGRRNIVERPLELALPLLVILLKEASLMNVLIETIIKVALKRVVWTYIWFKEPLIIHIIHLWFYSILHWARQGIKVGNLIFVLIMLFIQNVLIRLIVYWEFSPFLIWIRFNFVWLWVLSYYITTSWWDFIMSLRKFFFKISSFRVFFRVIWIIVWILR